MRKIRATQYALGVFFLLVSLVCAAESEKVTPAVFNDVEIIELAPLIVTGSHIPLEENHTFSPIITLSQEEIRLRGAQTPIESLRRLPSFVGSTLTENQANGGMGNASVSLRGQGPLATLTLINGRRAGGSGAINPPRRPGGFADMMLIPLTAVKAIEVVQDGASSTYGSDAIAGAVNVILHNDYDGTRFDVLYGNTTDKDAAVKQLSFLQGVTADKTHITIAGSFYHRNALARVDRELSRTGDFEERGANVNFNESIPSTGDYFYIPVGGGFGAGQGPGINLNGVTTDIPEQQILSAFAAFEQELSDQITVYSDFLFSNNRTDSRFYGPFFTAPFDAPASILTAANNSAFNPLNPGDNITGLTYNLQEALGGFRQEWESEGFRIVGGVRGNVNHSVDWDVGLLHTETDIIGNFSNAAIDADAFVDAIDSGLLDPFTEASGNAVILRAIEEPLINTYKEEMSLADFKLNGDLFELPAGPLKFATGMEFRHESIEFIDDPIHETKNLVGWFDLNNFSGERDCISVYGETIAPIIGVRDDIPGMHSLELNLGVRFEDFSDEGMDPSATSNEKVDNHYDSFDYKIAIRFKPIEQVVFRSSFNTVFRAPTLAESYSQYDALNRIQLNDPEGSTPAGTRVSTLFRGNADLEPETARVISFGTTLNPFSGLTISVDYYDIQREDAIVNGAQFIVDEAANNPEFFQLVARGFDSNFNPIFGNPDLSQPLTAVNSIYFNAAEMITRGIEYQVNYNYSFSPNNTLDLTFGANQFLSYKIKASASSGYESFKGKTVDSSRNDISPGSIPTWKGYVNARWFIENCIVGGTLNYVGSYKDDNSFTTSPVETDVASYTTLDLVFSYDTPSSAAKILQGTTITVGVNNVFDRAPPFAAGSLAGPPLGGYDQSLYSQRNRYWYFALAKTF